MTALLDAPAGDTPLSRRDRAILELFYASGLRLSELAGLDMDDMNLGGRVVRVLGKGGKERLVPFNTPAAQALREYLKDRAVLAHRAAARLQPRESRERQEPTRSRFVRARLSRAAASSRARIRCLSTIAAPASRCGASTGWCAATSPQPAPGWASARTRCGTPSPRTCCSAARICARSRSSWATRASARPSATRTSTQHSCWLSTGRRILGRATEESGALSHLRP